MSAQVVRCPACGQSGADAPGLALDEFGTLQAVFVGDEAVPHPQRLTCRACTHVWAVPRGSIEVRPATRKEPR
jgi:hypothetical protein